MANGIKRGKNRRINKATYKKNSPRINRRKVAKNHAVRKRAIVSGHKITKK
jgi:hypothetical protein